jgi:hypothetical protein
LDVATLINYERNLTHWAKILIYGNKAEKPFSLRHRIDETLLPVYVLACFLVGDGYAEVSLNHPEGETP